MQVDYQSYHNLQVELKSSKKRFISCIEYKDKSYQVEFFSYLEKQKQLRLLISGSMGETRFFDVEPDDFQISKFFIYDIPEYK